MNFIVSNNDIMSLKDSTKKKKKKKNNSQEDLQNNEDSKNLVDKSKQNIEEELNNPNEISNQLKKSSPVEIPDSKSLKKKLKNSIFNKISIISNHDSETSTTSEDVGSHSYWYRGECFQLVDDWETELENYAQVVIEQKIELIEVVRKCETINRYNIYHISQENNVKQFLFKCKDVTNCFFRNYCPSVARPLQFQVVHIDDSTVKPNYRNAEATISKDFIPACLPCFKPSTAVYINERMGKGFSKKKIGRFVEITGCSIQFMIQNAQGIDKWKIYGKYCQCGFCCKCTPIGECYIADFFIYDARADVESATPVGSLQKVFKGLSDVISNSNALILNFPPNASAKEKLVLIAAAMIIDFRFYDEVGCDYGNIL